MNFKRHTTFVLLFVLLSFGLFAQAPNSATPAGLNYTNNTPAVLTYFENARRVSNYLPLVEAWKTAAEDMVRSGIQPPQPPIPPHTAQYVQTNNGIVLNELTSFVYPQPQPITLPPVVSGNVAVSSLSYQAPANDPAYPSRIFVDRTDTVEPGTVVDLVGIPNIRPGKYKRGEVRTIFATIGFYDPVK